MGRRVILQLITASFLFALTQLTQSGLAQTKAPATDKPASNLEIVHEKLKADKKLTVAKYMDLTESEAAKFWPVYEEYQKDLQGSNEKLRKLLEDRKSTRLNSSH